MRIRKVIALSIVLCLVMSLAPLCAAAAPFGDVPEGSWYKEPVQYCAEHGLMMGTGENTFSPGTPMTRAMFVTVLYRIDQKLSQSATTEPEKTEPTQVTPTQPTAPTAEPTAPTAPTEPKPAFSDVKPDAYYAEAVAWAVENGVVQGYPDGTFRPDGTILRQDVACVIARYVKAAYPDLFRVPICEFEPIDMDNASQYAKTDIYFMADQDLMKGDENERFNPKSDLDRAEAATLLMRLYQRLTGETWQDWGKQG